MGRERETTGFSHKNNKQLYELAHQMGIKTDDYYGDDDGSQPHFDRERFSDDIEDAFANDYSTRRALEAANLAGEEDIPTSIGSLEDAYKAHTWMKDQHEGGGSYSSNQDRANITEKWVKKDREGIDSQLEDLKQKMLDQAAMKKEEDEKPKGPVVKSDKLAAASGGSTDDDQKRATQLFTDNYKAGVARDFGISSDTKRSLSNAARAVQDPYGR